MKKLREMHIRNGNRLMYGELRGVSIEDFPDFFVEERIGGNSIVYDEENNGFIIDIRNYTPDHMYYEHACGADEVLSSLIHGPLLLKMEELNEEENAQVKQVIFEILQKYNEYVTIANIRKHVNDTGELPDDLETVNIYYKYFDKKVQELNSMISDREQRLHLSEHYFNRGVAALATSVPFFVIASNSSNMLYLTSSVIVGAGAVIAGGGFMILADDSEMDRVSKIRMKLDIERKQKVLKDYEKERYRALHKYKELQDQENSHNLMKK